MSGRTFAERIKLEEEPVAGPVTFRGGTMEVELTGWGLVHESLPPSGGPI